MVIPEFQGYADGEMSFFSIMLKTPQTFSCLHTFLNLATSGPSSVHMIDGSIDMERPWMLYSGKSIRSVAGYARFVCRTRLQICSVAAARS